MSSAAGAVERKTESRSNGRLLARRISSVYRSPRVLVDRGFHTGELNWYFKSLGDVTTSMAGYATTPSGGTVERVTPCIYNESPLVRMFEIEVSVWQNGSPIQSLPLSSTFLGQQVTCVDMTLFNAVVSPGEFAILVSASVFAAENSFLGVTATDQGETFDVEIGGERPPTTEENGVTITMKGVGIRYQIDVPATPTFTPTVTPTASGTPPPPTPGTPTPTLGPGTPSPTSPAQTPIPGECVRSATTACLLEDRFEVEVKMWNFADPPVQFTGQIQQYGGMSSETEQSVSFYSFMDGNVEVFVKMVNACASASFESFWVFATGATNAETEILVRDTVSGEVYRIFNPRNQLFRAVADTQAFLTCDE